MQFNLDTKIKYKTRNKNFRDIGLCVLSTLWSESISVWQLWLRAKKKEEERDTHTHIPRILLVSRQPTTVAKFSENDQSCPCVRACERACSFPFSLPLCPHRSGTHVFVFDFCARKPKVIVVQRINCVVEIHFACHSNNWNCYHVLSSKPTTKNYTNFSLHEQTNEKTKTNYEKDKRTKTLPILNDKPRQKNVVSSFSFEKTNRNQFELEAETRPVGRPQKDGMATLRISWKIQNTRRIEIGSSWRGTRKHG